MRRYVRITVLLTAAAFLLSGCWNASDVDNLEYVNAIGIDYSKETKEYTVYLQLLSFEKVAKTEGGTQKDAPVPAWMGVGKGKSYTEAIGKIVLESQKRLFWGHVTALILGEGLLNKGEITDVLQAFFRFYELRYTMWVFGTSSELPRLFEAAPNFERSRLTMLIHTPLDNYRQRSYVAPMRLYDFIAAYYEPAKTLILPAVTLRDEVWRVNSKAVDSIRYAGVYPFRDQKSNGFIPLDKIKGMRWLERRTTRAPVIIMEQDKVFASLRMEKPDYSVHIKESAGKPLFDLKVKVRGTVSELNAQVSEEELKRKAGAVIEKEIRETYADGLQKNVDLLELQSHLYIRDLQRFRKYDKDQNQFILEPGSLDKVDVNVNITSAGKYTYRLYKDNYNK